MVATIETKTVFTSIQFTEEEKDSFETVIECLSALENECYLKANNAHLIADTDDFYVRTLVDILAGIVDGQIKFYD